LLALAMLSYSSLSSLQPSAAHRALHAFPTRRSSDLHHEQSVRPVNLRVSPRRLADDGQDAGALLAGALGDKLLHPVAKGRKCGRSEEHTSELQSRENLVCRLLLEKKKHKMHVAVLRQ